MENFRISVIFTMFLVLSVSECTFSQISRDSAYSVLTTVVLGGDYENVNIYTSKTVIPANDTMRTFYNEVVSPNFDSWLFFVDDHPMADWGHACRYIFVRSLSEFSVVNETMPPDMNYYDTMHEIEIPQTRSELINVPKSTSSCVSDNDYAVIISGGMDLMNNHERYWNNCSFIYSVLVNKYNFDRSKIYVIMADGTNPAHDRRLINGGTDSSPLDLDGDGTNDIQYSATKSNISTVFNTLSNQVTSDDEVFIFTTDHGDVGSKLILWGGYMTSSEFAAEVNKINAAKSINVLMAQCYSGGYITALAGNNRTIATSCSATEEAWATSNYQYSEFVYHWISAVNKKTPYNVAVNADTNLDGMISASEAFAYANANDTKPETPQFSNNGNTLSLSGVFPHISGYSTLGFCPQEYTLYDLYDCSSNIVWETSNNIDIIEGQNTCNVRISPNSVGSGWIRASVYLDNFTYTTPKKNITATDSNNLTLYYNTTITSSQTISNNIRVGGQLIVPNGVELTITSNVYFLPLAKIIVNPGGKLILDGAVLTTCDDNFWSGISVVGNKNKRQLSQYQGTLIVRNGTVIEKAIDAVVNSDGHDYNTAGGIIKAYNSTFRNNSRSLYFYPYTNTTMNGSPRDDVSVFENCDFINNNDNIFISNGISSRDMVVMNQVRGIKFSGCRFNDVRTYKNPKVDAILAMDAGFNVSRLCNGGLLNDCGCVSATISEFSGFNCAINATNSSSTNTFVVDDADFDDCIYGVSAGGINNFKVIRSDFDLNSTNNNNNRIGVYCMYTTGYKIEENNFHFGSGSRGGRVIDDDAVGISVNFSGQDDNLIYRNNFADLDCGIYSWNNAGLQFECNDFTNNSSIDINFVDSVKICQGTSIEAAGNKFSSNSYNLLNGDNSFTYYHSGAAVSTNQYYPQNRSNNVYTSANATANTCASTLCTPSIPGPNDPKGVGNSYQHYLQLQSLYNSRLQDFENRGYNCLVENNFDATSSEIAHNARLQYDTILTLRSEMSEIANRNISRILEDSVLNRDSLNIWLNTIETLSAKYMLADSYFASGDFANADAVLAAIPSHFDLSAQETSEHGNFLRFNAFRERIAGDNRNYAQLTESEISELEQIADAGADLSSTYASSVLCFFYGICRDVPEMNLDIPDNGNIHNKNSAVAFQANENEEQALSVFVYPNPANDNINILFNKPFDGRTTLMICDVTGRTLMEKELKSVETELNISNLKQGIYFHKVLVDGVVIKKDSFVKE